MYKHLTGGYKEEGARLFSVMLSDRMRGNGHRLKNIKFEHKKNLFYPEGGQTLVQVAQRGCGHVGPVENTAGHGPGQLGPGSCA